MLPETFSVRLPGRHATRTGRIREGHASLERFHRQEAVEAHLKAHLRELESLGFAQLDYKALTRAGRSMRARRHRRRLSRSFIATANCD